MLAEDFIAVKKPSWERLTALLEKSKLGGLVRPLGRRAKRTGPPLSRRHLRPGRLAARLPDPPRRRVSQQPGRRAHAAVYQGRATRRRGLLDFFVLTFPRTFRATWPYTLAAFLMCLLPALAGFAISYRDPSAGAMLLPGIDRRDRGHSREARVVERASIKDGPLSLGLADHDQQHPCCDHGLRRWRAAGPADAGYPGAGTG